MLKNLLIRLYCCSRLSFPLADKILRSLEPLEYKTAEECLRILSSVSEINDCLKMEGSKDPLSPPLDIYEKLARKGIKAICRWEEGYPAPLREIVSAPALIFYQGLLPNPDLLSVGIVGARKATPIGMQAARDFSRTLAEYPVSVISGLASGIDTAAHEGALWGGGYTLAVLGCGLNTTYPASNLRLRQQIIDGGGCILSEFPPTLRAQTWNFPRRNRIISGLCSGVIIIEAGLKSGSLITAKYALDQNRDLFAVPGSIRNPVSQGTNQLIKYGAVPVTEGNDVLNHYSLNTPRLISNEIRKEPLSPAESSLIDAIRREGAVTVDELVATMEFTVPQLLGHLASLEIKGIVEQWITGEYRVLT